jgi:catechol 2,3-dioxygenase-like lactoylglutathione lyase family enzyme
VAELPPPPEGIVLTHFIVSDDVERSRRFYTEVLGGRVERPGDPVNVALANSWIVINGGGGPTDDKPAVILETPRDPDRVKRRAACVVYPTGPLTYLVVVHGPCGALRRSRPFQ